MRKTNDTEKTRELTEDELDHVSGGKPSAAPKDPPVRESISLPYDPLPPKDPRALEKHWFNGG